MPNETILDGQANVDAGNKMKDILEGIVAQIKASKDPFHEIMGETGVKNNVAVADSYNDIADNYIRQFEATIESVDVMIEEGKRIAEYAN